MNKKTINDVDVSKFVSTVKVPKKYPDSKLRIEKREGTLVAIVEGNLRFRRDGWAEQFAWTATSSCANVYADWLGYAVQVLEEFEAWAAAEIEELNKPKLPTTETPKNASWRRTPNGILELIDHTGEVPPFRIVTDLDSKRGFEMNLATFRARAEACGIEIEIVKDPKRLVGQVSGRTTGICLSGELL